MLAPLLGLPKQSEILIIIFLGICFLSLDFSLFEISANLDTIWKLELTKARSFETLLKYIISAVVLARTFTLHAFLACYVVMLWPAIYEEKPNLMLPWLLLGILRCLFLTSVTFVVGTFICYKEKSVGSICLEYILAQIIEHGPSVYAWFSVLSFYRDLAGERDSNQSYEISLLSGTEKSIDSRDSAEKEDANDGWDKSKSYSLSDLNLDYMHSSRYRSLSGDMPMNVLIEELRHLVSKTRIIQDSSKSFNSLRQDQSDTVEVFETLSKTDLTIIEKTMKILEISDHDVANAQQDKNKLIQILREVKKEDVNIIDEDFLNKVTSPSFYIKKGHIHRGPKTHLPKSLSLHEGAKNTCMCSLRRKLEKEQSDLNMAESEIANIKFDETDIDADPINGNQKGKSNCSKKNCEVNSASKNGEAKSELKRGEAKFETKNCEVNSASKNGEPKSEPVANYNDKDEIRSRQQGNDDSSAESDEIKCEAKSELKRGEAKFEIKNCEAEPTANYNDNDEISRSQEGNTNGSVEPDEKCYELNSESKTDKAKSETRNYEAEIVANYEINDQISGSHRGNGNCSAASDEKTCEAKSFESKPHTNVPNWNSFGEGFSTNFIKNDIPYALSQCRVVLRASLGFNKTNAFSLKQNMSKNVGCQVSLENKSLDGSRSELVKPLVCLKNFKLAWGSSYF